MGTTLEGKQINQTYQGLLKTTDNNEVGASAKEITDGKGNGTGVTLDNSGNVTATSFTGDGSQLTNLPSAPVTSVNTQVGDVVLDTDDISEGTSNEYYTDAKVAANSAVVANTAKVGITTEQANEIAANTLKTGITTEQANAIVANTAKTGITQAQADAIVANTAKTGITAQQAADIQTNNDKVGITTQQANEITANTAKVGITPTQASEISANTLKVGITTEQANAITTNTAKNSYPSADATKLAGIEAGAEVNTVDSVNGQTGAVSLGLLDLDDVGSDGTSGQVLTTDGLGSFSFTTVSGGGGGAVDSVNGQTGVVVLDADDISDATTTNKFTSAADITKLSGIESGAEVNPTSTDELTEGTTNLYYTDARVSANTDVTANTAKVGITSQQAADIVTNNAKVGITTQQANDIVANNAKVGITTQQAADIIANNAKNSYPTADSTKVGHISVTQAVDLDTLESNVATNNAKVGITAQQAADIVTNNGKVSMVLGTTAGTALEGDTPLLQLGTTSTTALAGNTTTITAQQASDISTNNNKVGITTAQADAITANSAKVGITTQQASDIVTNNAKISYPSADSTKVGFISVTQAVDLDTLESNVATNNAKVGITTQQASDIVANNAKISFDSTSSTKLAGIEAGAEVNPTASEIKTSYESNANTNAFTDAEQTKLSGIEANAEVNVQSNWAATSGDAFILNKPTLATVATTGSYNDLSNTPTIPTNNNQLTNGAGYIDEAAQTKHTNAIGNAIDFSARVTLDGGVAEGTSGIIKNLQSIL